MQEQNSFYRILSGLKIVKISQKRLHNADKTSIFTHAKPDSKNKSP
jgi:hypothetical protein